MAKKVVPPLLIEEVQESVNHMYISLLEYKRKNYIVIIDNITDAEISAYVLDYANAEDINVAELLSATTFWYYSASERYPLSFEFSKSGLAESMSPLRRTFKKDYVSRLIGKAFSYEIETKPRVKRKRVQKIQQGVEIKFRKAG